MELTHDERVCLNWCARLNRQGVGFLGPTVRREGALQVYDSAVAKGLVTVVARSAYRQYGKKYGYWITDLGREALLAPPQGGDHG